MLSNLYMTLDDEVTHGYLHSKELSALHKACKIFSKIRSGKIYVNDLPVILCILRISISDLEMRQALKTVDIDVNGMLDFSNFLKAVADVSYLVSQNPAFQDALKIYCRIKGGRVSTDEVFAVLDSMGIPVNPEILEEVIKHTYIDTITEGSPLDEITSDRKLSSIAECYLKYKKKNSLSYKLPEPSISKKLNKNSNQYYSKIMENDDLESKRPKNTWQIRKFLGGVGSSNVEVQEPYSKNGINFKKHSEKGEIHDSKSKPQSLKCSTSLSKSLDKSDISSIPKLQKPAVRKRSSLLKQVSSTEKTAINTLVLPGVIKAIDKIKDKNMDYEDLNTCLQNLDIYLSKPEFKKITELTEAGVLPDATETLDNLRKETMSVSDLWNTLSSLNSNLKKDEFLAALKLVTVDETIQEALEKCQIPNDAQDAFG
ncbi:EF-hand calcium-binding domain-containing protein 13 isoform X7 [Hylobates moloch]|uniref:EF-hand calcium-binding domain-containing protein 13 isoform X7 n=1 Tax=Hylobates moloch TaxID=81572 RepID=UPI0026774ACE|nr:EF-hand calcium-binding domain-containing protein 13 isoform X7 [Hylobates moloch]